MFEGLTACKKDYRIRAMTIYLILIFYSIPIDKMRRIYLVQIYNTPLQPDKAIVTRQPRPLIYRWSPYLPQYNPPKF